MSTTQPAPVSQVAPDSAVTHATVGTPFELTVNVSTGGNANVDLVDNKYLKLQGCSAQESMNGQSTTLTATFLPLQVGSTVVTFTIHPRATEPIVIQQPFPITITLFDGK